jgi:metal-responsive CopG/Arc/MetJ family transcriptional regulator
MTSRKVTLSIPNELVEIIDAYINEHPGTTRSGVCAEALRRWMRERLEAEIEAYYRTQSDEERADDDEWRAIATESARRLWP